MSSKRDTLIITHLLLCFCNLPCQCRGDFRFFFDWDNSVELSPSTNENTLYFCHIVDRVDKSY